MKPYIFLTENYLKHAVDSNNDAIDAVNLSADNLPYTLTLFFTDRYGNAVNRNIDSLILANTNIKDMSIAALQNGNYTNFFTITGNTEKTIFVKNPSSITTTSLQITIPTTNNPASVYGTLGIYNFLCNLFALTDSDFRNEANEGGYRVVDGSYIHFGDYNKWAAKVKMENLPKAQFDLLTNQAKQVGELTAIPYKDLEASAIYECAVNRGFSWGVDRKTELFNLTLELNEL